MKVIRSLDLSRGDLSPGDLPPGDAAAPAPGPVVPPGSVVTIGNFDGVHVGHQEILRRAVARAKQDGLIPAVLTFDPHPARVLAPERAPRLITTTAQRL